jgi:hypothetical protein
MRRFNEIMEAAKEPINIEVLNSPDEVLDEEGSLAGISVSRWMEGNCCG